MKVIALASFNHTQGFITINETVEFEQNEAERLAKKGFVKILEEVKGVTTDEKPTNESNHTGNSDGTDTNIDVPEEDTNVDSEHDGEDENNPETPDVPDEVTEPKSIDDMDKFELQQLLQEKGISFQETDSEKYMRNLLKKHKD
jgi:hypothetical protein